MHCSGIARRGRGGRGGKAPATEARRPKKTAEQLDQEMLVSGDECYFILRHERESDIYVPSVITGVP